MQWYQIVTLIISALSLPTIAGLIWKDIYDKRKNEHKHIEQLKTEESQNILRDIIKAEIQPLNTQISEIINKMDCLSEGTLSSLRNDILTCYYRCREKGYRNDYDYQNIHDLFDAYAGLHGNSFICDIMKRFDKLPTKEQYTQQRQTNIGGSKDGEE